MCDKVAGKRDECESGQLRIGNIEYNAVQEEVLVQKDKSS